MVPTPEDATSFTSDYVESYRVLGGVLHNPRNDRRTTAGVFHVAEGGLPIPDDKIAVSRDVFAHLLAHAVEPPEDLLTLPWASRQEDPARCFVSLLLRPVVVPEVPGFSAERSMEIRFIAPGGLVSNLDFVEGIFGNGGDPYLPENDSSLAPESWTGHTGCVILAPHLTTLTKKELGLPAWEEADERREVDVRDPAGLPHRAHRVVELEPALPQRVPEPVGHGREIAGADAAPVVDEHEVEVAQRTGLVPSQGTDGGERDAVEAPAPGVLEQTREPGAGHLVDRGEGSLRERPPVCSVRGARRSCRENHIQPHADRRTCHHSRSCCRIR